MGTLVACGGESLTSRREPSASAAVLAVVPRDATVEVLEGAPRDGYYKVSLSGLRGWSYGAHYTERGSLMSNVVALNTNYEVVHKWFVSGTGWSAWENLGEPK